MTFSIAPGNQVVGKRGHAYPYSAQDAGLGTRGMMAERPDLPKIRFESRALFVSGHCLDRAVAPIYSYGEDVGS